PSAPAVEKQKTDNSSFFAPKIVRQPRKKAAAKKPAEESKPTPPPFKPQPIPSAASSTGEIVQQIFIWMSVVSVLAIILLLRILWTNIASFFESKKQQVCSECHWINPAGAEFCSKCGARLKPWSSVSASQKKWYGKFGWRRNPFTLDIMPNLFTGYQSQVETVLEKIYQKSGHIMITGNKGAGKTTLLKWLADKLKDDFHTIYIPRPTDDFDDLLEYMATSLKVKKTRDKKFSIYDIEAIASSSNKNILLLLDEAHEFTAEFERPLRSLGDLNGVSFVLAGLPETVEKIKNLSAPFYDRIVEKVVLEHLTAEETRDLIKKRIENVGGEETKPFTHEALLKIHDLGQGVPRKILKVCDWIVTDAIRHDLDSIGETAGAGYRDEGEKR
ncbi:MAG TPA: AAA family ATPase, partial [Candidatus Omnitrophota bacterium]|nr:AAA family ATPase [Candidatus Omnitrophota bacterium]